MNKPLILVVEDDPPVRNLITTTLKTNDYRFLVAANGEGAILEASSHNPDIVLLDLGLPDMDGLELLRALRAEEALTPVIVLSARTDEREKVTALDLGANDYVTKPFGSAELLARVRTALRNTRHSAQEGRLPGGKFHLDDMVIDYDARRVSIRGEEVKLTQTEYNIVAFLSEHCGKVMTYSAIIRGVWGYPDAGSVKRLQVNMANIRKKLGARPGEESYIVNELGVGYRMREPSHEEK